MHEVHEVVEQPAEEPVPKETTPVSEIVGDILEYYIATYPYHSQEQGDLSFNAGEMITVIKKEGEWWTGKTPNAVGIFPSNYVQKVDVVSAPEPFSEVVFFFFCVFALVFSRCSVFLLKNTSSNTAAPVAAASSTVTNTTPSIDSEAENYNQSEQNANNVIDNEVSQINELKMPAEKSPDFAAMAIAAGVSAEEVLVFCCFSFAILQTVFVSNPFCSYNLFCEGSSVLFRKFFLFFIKFF